VPYSLSADVQNSGSVGIDFDKANLIMKGSTIYIFRTTPDSIAAGSTKTVYFDDIMITSDPIIPVSLVDLPNTVDSNTRALWHLDEGDDNVVYDATPNSNVGETNATWGTGKFSRALGFTNPHHKINVSTSSSLEFLKENITIDAWIRPSGLQAEGAGIVCKGVPGSEQYCLVIVDNNKISFFVKDSFNKKHELNSSVGLADFVWQHVAGVFNEQTKEISVYVGKKKTDIVIVDFDGTLKPNFINDIVIGNRFSVGYDYPFAGDIDEVRISNVSRTFLPASEITKINLTYIVSHPEIIAVIVYNSTNDIIDTVEVPEVSSYSKTLFQLDVGYYLVEIETKEGLKIEKWYPSPPLPSEPQCISQSNLDKVSIISSTCPNTAFDTIPGADIDFVNCVVP